jgi:8-amino-7-oxononanoate synthase
MNGEDGSSGARRGSSALLAKLREAKEARDGARPDRPAALAPKAAQRAPAFDFAELPAYKQLRVQRAAAAMMRIENPFFRSHDGLAADTTSVGGRELLNFASYNYLGLNGHPEVVAAAKDAVDRYGISVSASRLVAGERPFHGRLERALADLHGVEDAVVMVSGHATNVTTIGTLLGPKDIVLYDALIHNSVVEGARLSGARRMTFPHNDWQALDRILTETRAHYERALIVVEGLYSMDGDGPELRHFIEVKASHDAWLMVDEAHSLGVMGATGRGICEAQGIDPAEVEIWMGTLSKTLSSCGGYVAGSSALVEFLKVTAPGFVYSVGLAAPLAAAAIASIAVLRREPERVARLAANGAAFLAEARAAGLDTGESLGLSVVPVIVGDSAKAAVLAARVFERGLNALPIIFPAVPEKAARLRFFITSEHDAGQIAEAVRITAEELAKLNASGSLLKSIRPS